MSNRGTLARVIGASLVLLVTLSPVPMAGANPGGEGDAADTRGKLDIAAIRHGHGGSPRVLAHRVITWEKWDSRVLGPGGKGDLDLIFSTRKNECAELMIRVVRRHGNLRAQIRSYDPLGCGPYDDSGGGSDFVKMDARVGRPSPRSVRIAFDRSELLPRWDDDYKWSVQTRWESDRCPNGTCYDSGPDEGRGMRGVVKHTLR